MMRKLTVFGFVTLLLLVACAGGQATEPTPEATTTAPTYAMGEVVVEAVIEPARWSELRFEIGGTVADVLVDPGEAIEAGDELIRLDPIEAKLAVEEAKAALASTKANLAQTKAEPRPEKIAAAEQDLEAAQAALTRAVAQRDQVIGGATEADIAAAGADLAAAEEQYREALRNRDEVYNNFDVDTSTAKRGYMEPDKSSKDRIIENADYQFNAAREALAAAQKKLESQRAIADERLREAEAGVWAASAQRDVAQADLELVKAGSASWEIASAEAMVQQAEVALARAEIQLERVVLRAPFDGTVTKVNVEEGDTVMPGDVVVVLAALDRLQARTIDLTELDVARVEEGQPSIVTVDALPDQEFAGTVREIALRHREYRGDVVYDVIVELTGAGDTRLRWGMTAVVEIEAE